VLTGPARHLPPPPRLTSGQEPPLPPKSRVELVFAHDPLAAKETFSPAPVPEAREIEAVRSHPGYRALDERGGRPVTRAEDVLAALSANKRVRWCEGVAELP
jgi:hypothetical protein